MQSIADLSMGERFKELARKITLDVHEVLAGEAFIMPHIPSKSWYKALPDTIQQEPTVLFRDCARRGDRVP